MFNILVNNYELFVEISRDKFMRISMNLSDNNLQTRLVSNYMLNERTVPLTLDTYNIIRDGQLKCVAMNLIDFEQHLFLVDGVDKLCGKLTTKQYITLEYTNQLSELEIALRWYLPPKTIHYIKDFKLYANSTILEKGHLKNLLLSPTTFQLAKTMLYESNTFI